MAAKPKSVQVGKPIDVPKTATMAVPPDGAAVTVRNTYTPATAGEHRLVNDKGRTVRSITVVAADPA